MKDTQAQSYIKTLANFTGASLLEHIKTIGTWKGDDLEECLESVIASRGQAKFDYDNPFEYGNNSSQLEK